MENNRPYWNMNIEPFLNTPQMKELQLHKLKIMIKRLYSHAPFHKERLKKIGITTDNIDSKIKSLEDFAQIVPVYEKEDYREHAAACGGDLIQLMDREMPVSVDDLIMVNSTTGTTGDPTPYPFAIKDICDVWGEFICRALWRAGLRKNDRFLHCFGLSMHIGGTATLMAIQKMGAMVIPVGAEGGTDRMFQMTRHYKPTAFVGTPSLASYLIDVSKEKTGKEAKELGIKVLFLGGEPGPSIPELNKKLREGFGAKLIDHGAGLGAGCDYPEYQGMHWIVDDLVIYELVDPKTKDPIPLEDGATGEAVFTHIEGDGMAWLRTSLGDIHEVQTSPCPCGGTGIRFKVKGRTDDMLKVKGVIVYPSAVTGVIEAFAPRVTGEYRIVLTERPPRVEPPLKIKIERGEDYPHEKLNELEKELQESFHSKIKINPKIIWQEPGELKRAMTKSKRFEKLYNN